MVGALLLVGSEVSRASPAGSVGRAPEHAPTLSRCVSQWNRASLGDRDLAALASAEDGTAALMSAFADGSCSLVFPSARGQAKVFVTGLDGDYALDANPLGGYAPSPSLEGQLVAQAERQTDVHVIPGSAGKIAADRNARMPTLSVKLLDAAADCQQIWTPAGSAYALVRTSVACPWVRSIIWSWSAHQHPPGSLGSPRADVRIIGWHCTGTRYGNGEFTQVICRTPTNLIEVGAEKAHIFD
jgi:hypothetical protein